jgi:major vault protein
MATTVIRLKPLFYVHIHDSNTNITTLLSGPTTYTIPQHQTMVSKEPQPYIVVPPEHYAIVENPVERDQQGAILVDKHGQTRNVLGEREIRLTQPPFPLYPGENLIKLAKLMVLSPTQAIVLHANRAFDDDRQGAKVKRNAGDDFMIQGPCVYFPRIEEEILEKRDAIIVKPNESLTLRARNKLTDALGKERCAGEEYLYSKPGAYMLAVDEQLVSVVPSIVLTPKKAIHVEVLKHFVDSRPWGKGATRNPGQVFLVTSQQTSEFTPTPNERVVKEVPLTVVTCREFAVVLDPVENGVQLLGRRKVITNQAFFLQPGERLEGDKVRPLYVLGEDESLLLTAAEEFEDKEAKVKRVPGELWLIAGPKEYVPLAEVRVVADSKGQEIRKKLVLPEGQGVYVRNTLTGEVRMISGCTYMLAAAEELWEKDVPKPVEELLAKQGNSHFSYIDKTTVSIQRDRTRVVKYLVPHNAITQVYDYKKRTQRTIFGPEAVLLGPDEQFTLLTLSGSPWDPTQPNKCLPKETGRIKALHLFLGPSNLSDVLSVETSDHARLNLQLSYDWYFDVEKGNKDHADFAFRVPDFVGDCCSCIASRIRASVAAVPFKQFHQHSASIVTAAVFGIDKETQRPKTELRFPSNRLVVTSVDIQEIEVVDSKTREALAQSVKMAIEITTQAQESVARQEASVREQQARGKLERQQIEDRALSEVDRKKLLESETKSNSISTTGQAKSEAKARAEAAEIEGDAAVAAARIKANTGSVMEKIKMELKIKKDTQDLSFKAAIDDVEVNRTKQLAEIESEKFKKTMESIGQDTVRALARAGPELQAKLLGSLGLQGYLVTDGTNPINLFNVAQGLSQQPQAPCTSS